MLLRVLLAVALTLSMAGVGVANTEYTKVTDRSEFLSLVNGRELTLPGISVVVTPSGEIKGRAWGRDVTGAWQWNNGYFCRDLFWGARDLGPNCQMVSRNGSKLRFTSDRGAGEYADLNLR